jgi:hypothetical protein
MLVAAFFLGGSAVNDPAPLDCIGAGPKTTKCWWMRTPRRDPDTRQGAGVFHGGVIKLTLDYQTTPVSRGTAKGGR